MAVACASRFACLKIEDLEVDQPEKEDRDKNTSAVKETTKPTQNNSKNKKKKKSALEAAELQSLVFGTNTNNSKPPKTTNQNAGKKKVRNQVVSEAQWQEWKAKDDKLVTDTFQQDLHEALLRSKIDLEEHKSDAPRKETENEPQDGKKKRKGTQKKDKTMSLDAFQSLLPSQIEGSTPVAERSEVSIQEKQETDFFERIEADAEKIVAKEHKMETFKKQQPLVAEQARSLQYREELECKDRLIEELRAQVQQLQDELKGAKYRNKKLCHILSHGEIRDKAEILVQSEQLTQVRDELTEEVQQLHAALEQERSKVHLLQMELKKQGHNKKDRKDSK